MSRPDEGLIHTWLDGECTPEEAARIERLVATDPEWAAAVAEARGLVAASARIVQALDSVPKAMPAGSRAAPASVFLRREPSRVRPWMRVAAGLVLVVGTSYLLRDEPSPLEPTAQLDIAPAPAASPAVGDSGGVTSRSVVIPQAPTNLPVGEVRTLERETSAPTAGAPAPTVMEQLAPPPSPPPPVTAGRLASGSAASAESANLAARREMVVQRESMRSRMTIEPARAAAAGATMADAITGAAAEKSLPTLAGCWRVITPPELAGVLREPMIVRQAGDTLVLRTTRGDVTVTRTSDRLRGGLEASLEGC